MHVYCSFGKGSEPTAGSHWGCDGSGGRHGLRRLSRNHDGLLAEREEVGGEVSERERALAEVGEDEGLNGWRVEDNAGGCRGIAAPDKELHWRYERTCIESGVNSLRWREAVGVKRQQQEECQRGAVHLDGCVENELDRLPFTPPRCKWKRPWGQHATIKLYGLLLIASENKGLGSNYSNCSCTVCTGQDGCIL